MKKILWVTDPHLNFNPSLLGVREKASSGEFSAVICTGDISEAPMVSEHIKALREAVSPLPLYFVLGNHDYYKGSLKGLKNHLLSREDLASHWLRVCDPVDLGGGVYLTGHDGMYDAILGFKEKSTLLMRDFYAIEEWRDAFLPWKHGYDTQRNFLATVRRISLAWAKEGEENIKKALAAGATTVLFCTHVPPFAGSCWHRGALSDGNWMPWFTSNHMGDMLARVASKNPNVEFRVFCGHTHSSGTYKALENLTVYTGAADYGRILFNEVGVEDRGHVSVSFSLLFCLVHGGSFNGYHEPTRATSKHSDPQIFPRYDGL